MFIPVITYFTQCCSFVDSTSASYLKGSNLGQETNYPEVFSGFTQSLEANTQILTQIRSQPLLSTILFLYYLTF
jgi:hypothetical protein